MNKVNNRVILAISEGKKASQYKTENREIQKM